MTPEICKCGKPMEEGYSQVKFTEGSPFKPIVLYTPAIATSWSCECGYNLTTRSGPYVDRGQVPAEEWTKINANQD